VSSRESRVTGQEVCPIVISARTTSDVTGCGRAQRPWSLVVRPGPYRALSVHHRVWSITGVGQSITGCGRAQRPWSLVVRPGQTIRVTLYDFGLRSLYAFQQVAAVLTATGRIAAATYRITLARAAYSLCFTLGREMPPKIAPSLGGSGSDIIRGSLCAFV